MGCAHSEIPYAGSLFFNLIYKNVCGSQRLMRLLGPLTLFEVRKQAGIDLACSATEAGLENETADVASSASTLSRERSNSYTMGCTPVREDNPRALSSGLSYVLAKKHGITINSILCHPHQCRHCTARAISCLSW